MARQRPPPGNRTVWAYAYQVVPPQPEARLLALKTLLDQERADAQIGTRTWEARFVIERQVTHILIVSDDPDLDLEANRRLEAELRKLKAGFAVTAPLAATDDTGRNQLPAAGPEPGSEGATL